MVLDGDVVTRCSHTYVGFEYACIASRCVEATLRCRVCYFSFDCLAGQSGGARCSRRLLFSFKMLVFWVNSMYQGKIRQLSACLQLAGPLQ